MKIKVSEASGIVLDWMVALANPFGDGSYWHSDEFLADFHPSTDWAQGGPIIEREEINIQKSTTTPSLGWIATSYKSVAESFYQTGKTPLEAAMRCYIASKLGDEVDVPEEIKE